MCFHCVKFRSNVPSSLGAFAVLKGSEEEGIIRIATTGAITIKIPMNIGIFNNNEKATVASNC